MAKSYEPDSYVKINHPEWSKNAVIYQVNTRQFTEEGTFAAAENHLPRLSELGIDLLWLMPIHEIGEKNRKGELGSPYSIKDYYSINPELGTLEDFRHFVEAAHDHDMKVILDWVANHTAWDNNLVREHPEWYKRDWKGDFRPTPWWDWSDIIELDFSEPELRKYMSEAMKYWVSETDIDGYRCDVAGFVPVDFWNRVRGELEEIKEVFMLAEWEARDLHAEAFDMSYAWSWYDAMRDLANGDKDLGILREYYAKNECSWPKDSIRMTFVSNHDKNAWEGTQFEQFGDGLEPAIVLSVVGEGMPLLYNGQEAGNSKRLKFFERDPIQWREHPVGDLYKRLFPLKKENRALWNGKWGATMIRVPNSSESSVFSFVRKKGDDKVFAVLNFSAERHTLSFREELCHGSYVEYLSGESKEIGKNSRLELSPWDYRIYVA